MTETEGRFYMDKEWVGELQAECLDDEVKRWELYCCFELGRDVGEEEGIGKVTVRGLERNPFSRISIQTYREEL